MNSPLYIFKYDIEPAFTKTGLGLVGKVAKQVDDVKSFKILQMESLLILIFINILLIFCRLK
jgi:hypothetical protein